MTSQLDAGRASGRPPQLRASVRRRLLRQRVEGIEALPLDRYLQAVLSFALAAGAESLAALQAELDSSPSATGFEGFAARIGSSSERYDLAVGVAGWAYAARVVEITYSEKYEDVIGLVVQALPPKSRAERRIVDFGALARRETSMEKARLLFQRTVLSVLGEAVHEVPPSEDSVARTLPLWLLAWAEGWAAFGQLQGQYFPSAPAAQSLSTGR
jgi:hypothetical protein